MRNNGFAALQVFVHRLDILSDHVDEFAKFLPNFYLLAGMDGELEVLRSFKDQDNGATQAEPTHLLGGFQGLTVKERRGGRVHCLAVSSWRWELSTFVRSEILRG